MTAPSHTLQDCKHHASSASAAVLEQKTVSAPLRLPKSAQMVYQALRHLAHPSAMDIFDWLKQQSTGPEPLSSSSASVAATQRGASLTSVYRGIHHLVEAGQVKPMHFRDGQLRYELLNRSEDEQAHHHHFICTDCREVALLAHCPFEQFRQELGSGYEVHYHNFEIYGRCPRCVQSTLAF
ncbi:MAG: transcriptional repressor [Candidatus Melainabacteria bacterium]|nr:transcriptional repressor [Candidatus Melainabacteria bacterium]